MGERRLRRRRVLIDDARCNGNHLRVTWHPETRQFVVSTWSAGVCTGSARVRAEDAPELATLLVDGLADAATTAPVAASAAGAPPATGPRLGGLVDRLRWLVRGTLPSAGARIGTTPAATLATVRRLRRDSA